MSSDTVALPTDTHGGLVVRDMAIGDYIDDIRQFYLYLPAVERRAEELSDGIDGPDIIGLVAEANGELLGYAVCFVDRNQIAFGNMSVYPCVLRRGIGTALMDRLKQELSARHLRAIMALVENDNLAAQLFLKAMGFRYVHATRYDDYRFIYRPPKTLARVV